MRRVFLVQLMAWFVYSMKTYHKSPWLVQPLAERSTFRSSKFKVYMSILIEASFQAVAFLPFWHNPAGYGLHRAEFGLAGSLPCVNNFHRDLQQGSCS
jgi:hypothetical protein